MPELRAIIDSLMMEMLLSAKLAQEKLLDCNACNNVENSNKLYQLRFVDLSSYSAHFAYLYFEF